MSIVAAFDKVLFYNATSKYVVLRLKTADTSIPEQARGPYRYRDHLIRFTAVGYDLPQTDAVKLELDGIWKDGKYGCQLQVEWWHEIVPPTTEGVRNYLASGLLKGIGEKTADAIVAKFGVNALEVLEKHPERLLEIRGITEERLEDIKAGYAESKMMRDLMTLLSPFKVTPSTALKIYQHFGPDGVAILRKSPFRLCQIPGFGFRRVDAIVQKSGGDLHDPMRVQGALFYTLEKARSERGHLFLESEELAKGSLQLLNEKIPIPSMRLSRQQVDRELEAMVMSDVVVSNRGNIYLPHVFMEESETAYKVVQSILERPAPVDLASALEQVKSHLGITLTQKQSLGVETAFLHNLSIITGGPGTGKSTVLKAVIEVHRLLYPSKTIVLGAPTGKASRRMAETTGVEEAQTLHSILGLHGEDSGWQRKKKELDADFLIVDETSMVDMWLAHQLFLRLRAGTKILLVGDADQLESVGAGSVFHELLNCGLVPVTVLDEIFRQAKDSLIAYNAKFINEGESKLYYGPDFSFIKAETQQETAETIRALYKEELAKTGSGQVQILSPFRSEGEASSNGLNEAIREEVNPASDERAEVMFGGRMFRLPDTGGAGAPFQADDGPGPSFGGQPAFAEEAQPVGMVMAGGPPAGQGQQEEKSEQSGAEPAAEDRDTGADDDKRRQEHEAAEAARKADWEAKQLAKKQREQAALQELQAMSEQDLLKASMKRVCADTEKLTRRNMKDCVSEHIQTKCLEDLEFARMVMHPRKSMLHCFQHISHKAWDYVQDELKADGIQPGPDRQGYGADIPDGLCYQWAEEYFRDPDAKEDQEDEEEFIPRPYVGKSSGKKANKKKAPEKKEAAKKEPAKKPAPAPDGQITLGDLAQLPEAV